VVLDAADSLARLRRAPRTDRFLTRLSVRRGDGATIEEQAVLVVDKHGLRRVERDVTTKATPGA